MPLTLYGSPAGHRRHIRTTNPIGSSFAAARPRTARAEGGGGRAARLTMALKPTESASEGRRSSNGSGRPRAVISRAKSVDGAGVKDAA